MIFEVIKYLAIFSILPAAIIAVGKFKSYLLPDVKMLAQFIIFTIASELITTITSSSGFNTAILTGIHSTIETFFIAFYFSAQGRFHKLRTAYLLIMVLFGVFMVVTLANDPYSFPAKPRSLQSCGVVLMCIFHGYKWLKADSGKLYEILVIMALITYYLLTLGSFYYASTIPSNWVGLFWMTNDLFTLSANLLLFLALFNYVKSYGPKRNHLNA